MIDSIVFNKRNEWNIYNNFYKNSDAVNDDNKLF